jgi:hypothetical protein
LKAVFFSTAGRREVWITSFSGCGYRKTCFTGFPVRNQEKYTREHTVVHRAIERYPHKMVDKFSA